MNKSGTDVGGNGSTPSEPSSIAGGNLLSNGISESETADAPPGGGAPPALAREQHEELGRGLDLGLADRDALDVDA